MVTLESSFPPRTTTTSLPFSSCKLLKISFKNFQLAKC
jgi:hypothetical protein